MQPFKVAERDDFKEFVETLRSDYHILTQNTVKKSILARFHAEKNCVRLAFKKELSEKRCRIIADMCTTDAERGYIVLTLHYIDENSQIETVIIVFIFLFYLHTFERLTNNLMKALQDTDTLSDNAREQEKCHASAEQKKGDRFILEKSWRTTVTKGPKAVR